MAAPINPPNKTPPKVEEAIVKELAGTPKGKRNVMKQIAKDFGVSEAVAQRIQQRRKKDIGELRAIAAEDGMELVIGLQEQMRGKLGDKEAMKATPLRDLALSVEKLTNSAVTAQDGHAPQAQINIGFVKDGMKALEGYDARIKALRAIEVPVTVTRLEAKP